MLVKIKIKENEDDKDRRRDSNFFQQFILRRRKDQISKNKEKLRFFLQIKNEKN